MKSYRRVSKAETSPPINQFEKSGGAWNLIARSAEGSLGKASPQLKSASESADWRSNLESFINSVI